MCKPWIHTALLRRHVAGRRSWLTLGYLKRFVLFLLLVAVLSGCGSESGANGEQNAAGQKNATLAYAATPRKALEAWVTAVRGRDLEMVCRLLRPMRGCRTSYDEQAGIEAARNEMRGLTGRLRFGFVKVADPGELHGTIGIGIVYGESPAAYAVLLLRGRR